MNEPMPMEAQMPAPVMMGHTSEGALKTHIESDIIIDQVKHVLKCEEPIQMPNGLIVWRTPDGVEPIINSRGINRIMAMLKSRINKVFIFSDLEKENVENMTIKLGQDLLDSIYYNWENFDIKDTADASIIVGVVTDTVYATLRKGYDSTYLKFLRTTSQISEVQHRAIQGIERVPQQSGGVHPFKAMRRLFGVR